jgi:hypothetical protein
LTGRSRYDTVIFPNNPAVTGIGLASVTATQAASTTTFAASPLILPGLFTAAQAESARPMNRVFFDYGFFDSMRTLQVPTAGLTGLTPTLASRQAFFDLHRYTFGVEKTFLDGRASVVVRVPVLDTTEDRTGQAIDGLGDISAGLKVALWQNCETGSTLSAGFNVTTPTGRDEKFVINQNFPIGAGGVVGKPTVTTATVNPTFLQPWLGGLWVKDRLVVQEYLGVIIPTEDRVSTLLNNDIAVGYQVYRCNGGGWLTSIMPLVEAQVLVPLNHEGSPAVPGNITTGANVIPLTAPAFNFPDQLFVTGAVQFGLGKQAVLSTGVVTPVMGPKAFNVGATIGLNIFF